MNNLNLLLRRYLSPVDKFLDRLTMYRLVMYFLLVLWAWSIFGALFHRVGFPWYDILISGLLLMWVCWGVNTLLSKYLNIPKNSESDVISGLILTLILSPGHSVNDFWILAIAGAVAMLSKYILVIRKWHIFNPAALGAFASAELFSHYASWWVGTSFMTPIVFIGGMLVLRKVKRFIMALTFELVALAAILSEAYLTQTGPNYWHIIWVSVVSAPLLFLAYIMLTEPFTSPRHKINYLPYAVLVGFLYGYVRLGISPEEAILIGNIFIYIAEPNRRVSFKFSRRVQEAAGIESFVFSGKEGFKYTAGQYMEWTINQHKADTRGNRRYFTIASSPTEPEIMFTVRVPDGKMSTYKEKLGNFKKGEVILGEALAGEFMLPKSEKQKLAFMAGGVGITPFRSMVKYAIDFGHERDIHLFYSASTTDEFAFKDLFNEAQKIGVQTSYITEKVDQNKIKETLPDYQERTFYISGPYGFVQAMENNLLELGLPLKQIKTDYFPGYN